MKKETVKLVKFGLDLTANIFSEVGKSKAQSSIWYILNGTHLGVNHSNGCYTHNEYSKKNIGCVGRVSNKSFPNCYRLPGYYESKENGIKAYLIQITNPEEKYSDIANVFKVASEIFSVGYDIYTLVKDNQLHSSLEKTNILPKSEAINNKFIENLSIHSEKTCVIYAKNFLENDDSVNNLVVA